jgi:uncharacterized protein (TIRG00374 family)
MQKSVFFAVKAVLSAGLITYLTWSLDFAAITDAIANISPLSVLICTLILFAQIFVLAFRWHLIARAADAALGFLNGLRILFAAMFFMQVLPSSVGGDAVRVFMAHRRGIALAPATSVVLMDRAVGLTSIIILMGFFGHLITRQMSVDQKWLVQTLPFLALAAIVIGFVLLPRIISFLSRWRWANKIVQLLTQMNNLVRLPRIALQAFTISFSSHAMTAAAVWVLASDLVPEISYFTILAFLPPVVLLMILPITIAGWGLRESIMVVFFQLSGYGAADGLIVSVLWGLATILSTLPGALFWLLTRDSNDRLPPSDTAPPPRTEPS